MRGHPKRLHPASLAGGIAPCPPISYILNYVGKACTGGSTYVIIFYIIYIIFHMMRRNGDAHTKNGAPLAINRGT
jgi:hypothetical protein